MTPTPRRPGSGLESWLRSAASGNDADPEAVALWGELVGLRARVPELENSLRATQRALLLMIRAESDPLTRAWLDKKIERLAG